MISIGFRNPFKMTPCCCGTRSFFSSKTRTHSFFFSVMCLISNMSRHCSGIRSCSIDALLCMVTEKENKFPSHFIFRYSKKELPRISEQFCNPLHSFSSQNCSSESGDIKEAFYFIENRGLRYLCTVTLTEGS